MAPHPKTRRRLAVLALAGLTAGCAESEIRRRDQGPRVSGQGSAYELVLGTPEIEASLTRPGREFSRRDGARPPTGESFLAAGVWPGPDAPSLDRARVLTESRRRDTFIYYNPRGRSRHDHRRGPTSRPHGSY